jgi:hypothetical protein
MLSVGVGAAQHRRLPPAIRSGWGQASKFERLLDFRVSTAIDRGLESICHAKRHERVLDGHEDQLASTPKSPPLVMRLASARRAASGRKPQAGRRG